MQAAAHAGAGVAMCATGGTSRAGTADAPGLSGGPAGERTGRAGTEDDRTPPARRAAAADEDAGRVRLQPIAEGVSFGDPGTGEWGLPWARRAGDFSRRARDRENAPLDRAVRGGVPAEAARALHHGGGPGERAGGSEAPTATAPSAGAVVALRADRLGRSGLRADGGCRSGVPVPGGGGACREGGGDHDHQLAVLGMDAGDPEQPAVQGAAGSSDGSGAHHRDRQRVLSISPHAREAEEEGLKASGDGRGQAAARWGFRLALALSAPPFGLRRASLQPEPHRARFSLIEEKGTRQKDQTK